MPYISIESGRLTAEQKKTVSFGHSAEYLRKTVLGKHTVATTFAGETSLAWLNLIINQLYQLCFDVLFIEFFKMTTVDTMNHFMLNKEMIVVGSTYWNIVYGKNIGDVLSDDEGMANMHNLGGNMAWLIKRLDDEQK